MSRRLEPRNSDTGDVLTNYEGVSVAARNGRVLVVDDHPEIGRIVSKRLRRDGIAADCAHDGPEALRMLGNRAYGVLLLDYMMAGMSGRAVAEAVRAEPQHDALRIVFHLDTPGQAADADLNVLRVQGAIAKSAPFARLLETLFEPVPNEPELALDVVSNALRN